MLARFFSIGIELAGVLLERNNRRHEPYLAPHDVACIKFHQRPRHIATQFRRRQLMGRY